MAARHDAASGGTQETKSDAAGLVTDTEPEPEGEGEGEGEDALTGQGIPAGQSYTFPVPVEAEAAAYTVSLNTAVVMSIRYHDGPMRNPFTGTDLDDEVETELQAMCDRAGLPGPVQHRALLLERSEYDNNLPSLRAMLNIHVCLKDMLLAAEAFDRAALPTEAPLPATKDLLRSFETALPSVLTCMGYRIAELDFESAEEGLIAVRQQMNPEADLIARARRGWSAEQRQQREDEGGNAAALAHSVAAACNEALTTLRSKLYPAADLRPDLSKRSPDEAEAINTSIARLLDTVLVEMSDAVIL